MVTKGGKTYYSLIMIGSVFVIASLTYLTGLLASIITILWSRIIVCAFISSIFMAAGLLTLSGKIQLLAAPKQYNCYTDKKDTKQE